MDFDKYKILYVTGKSSFINSGAKDYIKKNISKKSEIIQFNDFSANPKFEDVRKGVKFFLSGDFNCIVAVGGGSVIDMAKLIIFYSQKGTDKFDSNVGLFQSKCPLVAIPTTAGSGSEETHFAVVYDKDIKYSIAHPSLKPTLKILIPELAFNCPTDQKLTSALDAFCQSIESFWSKNSSSVSKNYSRKAILIFMENLEKALVNNDFDAFKKVVKASNYAGKAINISKTTGCHALSYFFTTKFNIPHGKSVAMLMPYVFDYHYKNMPESDIMNELTGLLNFETTDYFLEFNKYFKNLGLVVKFEDFGINIKSIIDDLIKNVNRERLKNNPIEINIKKLFKI